MELLCAFSLAQLGWYCGCPDDLNAWRPYSVTRSHLSVHLLNSTVKSSVSIFLVHIVIPSSALISQPDSIVLNFGRILLKNLQYKLKKLDKDNLIIKHKAEHLKIHHIN